MGRKKLIEDDALIQMIDRYLKFDCDNRTDQLKIPAIGEYIRKNGYPDFQDYLLRRNETASEYMRQLKECYKESSVMITSTYKTLDVDEFLEKNSSRKAMKKALSELSMYYKTIAESASLIQKEHKELKRQRTEAQKQASTHKLEFEQMKADYDKILKEKKELMSELKIYKKVVNDYVYPEVANELLKKTGLITKTADIVTPEVIERSLIKADTKVKSQSGTIKELFRRFDE